MNRLSPFSTLELRLMLGIFTAQRNALTKPEQAMVDHLIREIKNELAYREE